MVLPFGKWGREQVEREARTRRWRMTGHTRDRGTYRECLAWFGRRVSRVLQKVTEAPGICQVPVCPARLLPTNLLGGSADGDALAPVHPS